MKDKPTFKTNPDMAKWDALKEQKRQADGYFQSINKTIETEMFGAPISRISKTLTQREFFKITKNYSNL